MEKKNYLFTAYCDLAVEPNRDDSAASEKPAAVRIRMGGGGGGGGDRKCNPAAFVSSVALYTTTSLHAETNCRLQVATFWLSFIRRATIGG